MKRYIVTITPPTPNGDLHLGHLSGPFLAADVMQRALRQQGHEVLFVTYSDDYQSYLPRKTNVLRREPFAYARLMREAMNLSLRLVNINLDYFMQAADNDAYRQAGEHYASKIAHQVTLRPYKTFYCAACDVHGYEGFGRTACNWCGTSSDASQCEHCAKVPAIEQIESMQCMACQGAMQPRQVTQHVWAIGQNYAGVAQALAARPKRVCLARYLDEALAQDTEEWPITRPGDAGLALAAVANYPVHTWFLGLAGYRASVQSLLAEQPEKGAFQAWWNPHTELVHFLGFDCSYSHAVAYNCQLLADPQGPTPGTFITNRFLKLDGEDFSTSRGHAVWIKDLAGQYPADAIRLYCALYAPETQVNNFEREHFQAWCRDTFMPLATAATQVRSATTALSIEQLQQLQSHAAWQQWQRAASVEQFSMAQMADALLAFAAWLQNTPAYAQSPLAWAALAELAAPLCPDLAAHIVAANACESAPAEAYESV